MSELTRTVKKRDAVKRLHAALREEGYRCTQESEPGEHNGFAFSLWYGAKGTFILWANERTQEFQFARCTDTQNVEEDIALL
jgi:hypothetical protein